MLGIWEGKINKKKGGVNNWVHEMLCCVGGLRVIGEWQLGMLFTEMGREQIDKCWILGWVGLGWDQWNKDVVGKFSLGGCVCGEIEKIFLRNESQKWGGIYRWVGDIECRWVSRWVS